MSNYGYVDELLGAKTAPPGRALGENRFSYVDELLAPSAPKGIPQGQPTAFDRLPLANRNSTEGTASFAALSKAAMVDDPETKARIVAQDLFPGDPDPLKRFGMVEGELVYERDGKLFRATPGGFLGGAKQFGANMAGNALPIAGGVAGAVLGAPTGGLASGSLAALGAAGGKGVQQLIANVALNEPQTPTGNLAGMAQEAAFSLVGDLVGRGAIMAKQAGSMRDANRLNLGRVVEIDRKAADVGGTGQAVDLNIAQRTNIPSLVGRVEAIARMPGAAADDVNTRLAATNAQAADAGQAFISGFSGRSTSARVAGESGREGAGEILSRIARDRSTAAAPLYQKALQAQVPATPELVALSKTDAWAKAWPKAISLAKNDGIDLMDGQNSMLGLHYIKLALDARIDKKAIAAEGLSSTEQAQIIGIKNRLLGIMDSASPDYARARSIYGHFTESLKPTREGIIGDLADLADHDLSGAASMVFSPKTAPEDVARMRSLFFKYDQGDKWKDLVGAYMQETFNNAGREFKSGTPSGQAATWRYMMFGNKAQRENLRAAMTREQFAGLSDMMDVFEAVNRTRGTGGSITMPMMEAGAQLRDEARSGVANVMRPRQALINWLDEAALGRHLDKQVDVLFSKDGIRRIQELKRMDPESKQFIRGFTTLFGVSMSPEGEPAIQ